MNPVDPNSSIRSPRPDTATQGSRATDRSAGGTDGQRTAATPPPAAEESVSITRAAEDLLSLEAQLKQLPGIDTARVEQIRTAIAEGRYEVDPQRIVDGLLQSERDFR